MGPPGPQICTDEVHFLPCTPVKLQAARGVLAEGGGWREFFRGVGPRALSNGLNSAIFFMFFEAIRRVSMGAHQRWHVEMLH